MGSAEGSVTISALLVVPCATLNLCQQLGHRHSRRVVPAELVPLRMRQPNEVSVCSPLVSGGILPQSTQHLLRALFVAIVGAGIAFGGLYALPP